MEQVESDEALLLSVDEAQALWGDLTFAGVIIFGAPTYTDGPSAQFKAFEDASSRAVMTQGYGWKDKIAAGFTNSGSRSGDNLAIGSSSHCSPPSTECTGSTLACRPANHSSTGSEAEMNRLGFSLGAGAQSNTDQGPDVAPPEADPATARYLGRSVAQATLQFVRGRAVLEAGVRDTVANSAARHPIGLRTGRRPLKLRASNRQVRRWSLDIAQDPRRKVTRAAYAASNERMVASSPHPTSGWRSVRQDTAGHPTQAMISPELKSAISLKCLISAPC